MNLYEDLFRQFLYPFYEGVLRRRGTLKYLAEYERTQWLSAEEIAALQWSRLKRLVEHCWREVPYYQRQWKALGFNPSDMRSRADFELLPVIGKSEVRANFEDLHASSMRGRMLYKTTGGSTGEPMRFGYTRESYERRVAVMWRGYGWAGARMGRRTLYLWGGALGEPGWLESIKERFYHRIFNRRMFNAFGMDDSRMREFADAIRRFRPAIIVGYAGPLYHFAQWIGRTGGRVPVPVSVLSAAEALEDYQRETIESAFGCPVYNTYGCREFMLIASQCADCGNLHVNADHLFVELGDRATNGRGAEAGEVVITDLHNWGMPLLRYRNGDLATPAPVPAHRCARGLPILGKVVGRKLDMLRTRNGRTLPGEFFPHLLKDVAGVRRFQVIQERLDLLVMLVVAGPEFGAEQEAGIRRELARVLGPSMELVIRRVDDIPLTPGGKLRVTISRLP